MKGLGLSVTFLNCDVNITNKRAELISVVDDVVKLAKMNKLGKVVVRKGAPYLPGLSVIQTIETSHIALHGFSNNSTYMFSIESCKSFNHKKIIDYLIVSLRPRDYIINSYYTIQME